MINIDSLEFDIKRALVTSPNAKMQWKKIRDELLKKYTNYDEDTFTTTLQRKLKQLYNKGDLRKKSVGHQEVYYYIPKNRVLQIKEQLDRELAHTLFDKAWESFSPDQRKRELQYLLNQRGHVTTILQNMKLGLSSFVVEQIESNIPRLENPTEDIKSKFSLEERERISEQLKKDLKKINLTILDKKDEMKSKIDEKKFESEISFMKEFLEKVVEPNYSGNFVEAVRDLMKKALEKEKKRCVNQDD